MWLLITFGEVCSSIKCVYLLQCGSQCNASEKTLFMPLFYVRRELFETEQNIVLKLQFLISMVKSQSVKVLHSVFV